MSTLGYRRGYQIRLNMGLLDPRINAHMFKAVVILPRERISKQIEAKLSAKHFQAIGGSA
jgi:hypothetical protein